MSALCDLQLQLDSRCTAPLQTGKRRFAVGVYFSIRNAEDNVSDIFSEIIKIPISATRRGMGLTGRFSRRRSARVRHTASRAHANSRGRFVWILPPARSRVRTVSRARSHPRRDRSLEGSQPRPRKGKG
eukprot:31417-Pelagococcus_subviridis.AAC.8